MVYVYVYQVVIVHMKCLCTYSVYMCVVCVYEYYVGIAAILGYTCILYTNACIDHFHHQTGL